MSNNRLEQSRLEKIRRDFIANVSHELRTPLTVVSGYLELLLDQDDKSFDPQWQRIFEQMQSQTNRMQHLVEDLLLLSSIESAELPGQLVTKINMASMLQSICDDAQVLSGDKQHHISSEVDESLTLMGNRKEIRSAFSNIVFNAVRYTPAGGDITLKWYHDGDEKVFSVKDTGIGIDADHLPRLTERFYRVDKSRSRDDGGTGLGLAIVKHVLIRHHGRLVIHSEAGKGSEFCCHFPINHQGAHEAE